jgi:hypothetical protein
MTKYKVTGPVPFDKYQPGEEFEAELDEELEERALERGSISVVGGRTSKTKKEEGNA